MRRIRLPARRAGREPGRPRPRIIRSRWWGPPRRATGSRRSSVPYEAAADETA